MAARPARKRPRIFVLAGVNGAGKSSVVGHMLREHGLTWFNPDAFSRELVARGGMSKEDADAAAWAYGLRTLEAAIAEGRDHAFETTLGGTTITRLLAKAAETHDVLMIYCGLVSVELHIERVTSRVRHGGHDIPEARIRARWETSREHLVELLPHLAHLQAFDNSQEAVPGEDIPEPVLVLEMKSGQILYPQSDDAAALEQTPNWAKPIVAAAFRGQAVKTPPQARTRRASSID